MVSKVINGLAGVFGLARALPAFFREKITVDQARGEIKRAVERRGESFLELARALVYANPSSPYFRLLKIAGCGFSDLRSHVRAHGLEATLERLAAEGVYLTSDEFKGKEPVIRGRETFRISPKGFAGQAPVPGFVAQSSGTSSQPTSAKISLDWQAQVTLARAIFFSAHRLFSSVHATYDGILPASGGINNLNSPARG